MDNQILDVLSKQLDILNEVLAYQKLQADLLQRLLENKQTASVRNIEAIEAAISKNPVLGKIGITPDVMKSLLEKMGG